MPANGTAARSLTLMSTNSAVAGVDETGQVTAVGAGAAQVVVSADGLEATVDVEVQQAVATLTVTPESHTLVERDETVQFTADVRDENGQLIPDVPVTWSSSDPEVASIDGSGLATAHKSGAVEITADVEGGSAGPAGVAGVSVVAMLVVDLPPATVTVEPTFHLFTALGLSVRFKATVMDAGGALLDDPVSWSSTASGVASVDSDGQVTAVGSGRAEIEAAAGEVKGSADVTVFQEVEQLTIDPTEFVLSVGEQADLMVSALDAQGQPVTGVEILWQSGDGAVASVVPSGSNKATVTGVGGGTTTIRAVSRSGKAAEAAVLVLGGGGDGDFIVMADINLFSDSRYDLLIRNLSENGERQRVVWYEGHDALLSLSTSHGPYAAGYIENTLDMTLHVVTDNELGFLEDINPEEVASLWLVSPQASFTEEELTLLLAYMEGGGRVIIIGENSGSGFDATNARQQELIFALGSDMVFTDGCINGLALPVIEDPITRDMTSLQMRCSSTYTNLGEADQALFQYDGQIVIARVGIGTRRPLPTLRVAPSVSVPTIPGYDPTLGPPPGSGSER